MDLKIAGKVALVVAASKGLGKATALTLAQEGAQVCISARDINTLNLAAEEIHQITGTHVLVVPADVTIRQDLERLAQKVRQDLGAIDILVNNAGIIKRIPMIEMKASEFRQVIDVDLNAPFIVAKAVLPSMIKKGAGKIINICSMMSELGRETVSAYAAAKGGLKMLTRNIASEYGEYNIQCNGIGPGYIATPQTAPLRTPGHPFNSFIIAKTPAARWGTTEDLEGPAVFLASEASDFVNGHVLYVDGGILAYIGKQPQ